MIAFIRVVTTYTTIRPSLPVQKETERERETHRCGLQSAWMSVAHRTPQRAPQPPADGAKPSAGPAFTARPLVSRCSEPGSGSLVRPRGAYCITPRSKLLSHLAGSEGEKSWHLACINFIVLACAAFAGKGLLQALSCSRAESLIGPHEIGILID